MRSQQSKFAKVHTNNTKTIVSHFSQLHGLASPTETQVAVMIKILHVHWTPHTLAHPQGMEIVHICIIDKCIFRNETGTDEISETFWSQELLHLNPDDWNSEHHPRTAILYYSIHAMSVAIIPTSMPWIIVIWFDCGRDYCHAFRGSYCIVHLEKQCSWRLILNTTNVLRYRTSCGHNVYVNCVRYGLSQMPCSFTSACSKKALAELKSLVWYHDMFCLGLMFISFEGTLLQYGVSTSFHILFSLLT